MVTLIHVLIALGSIGYTTHTFFKPSQTKLRVSYGFIAATLVSGTYLVLSTHAPLLQSCRTGLLYLGVVSAGIAAAHYRLAHATERVKTDV